MQSANPALSSFYEILHKTGIDYYFTKDKQSLQSHRPVVCAACLVVLEHDPKQLSLAQAKILEGMLKVLDLAKDDYCVAWIRPRDLSVEHLLKYAPYGVLFLSSAFEKISMETLYVAYTYSPQELEADPTRKRSAFETLLALKTQLSSMRAPKL